MGVLNYPDLRIEFSGRVLSVDRECRKDVFHNRTEHTLRILTEPEPEVREPEADRPAFTREEPNASRLG